MKTAAHWADIAMSIHDRIQRNPRVMAIYKDGDKVKTSTEGSELYGTIFRLRPHSVIGVYDSRATLKQIEADIVDAMRMLEDLGITVI